MNAPSKALLTRTEIWNALRGLFGTELPFQGGVLRLNEAEAPAPGSTAPRFTVQTAEAQFIVTFDSFPYAEATGIEMSIDALDRLPPALAEVLADGTRDLVLDALPERMRRLILSAERMPADQPMAAVDTWLGAEVQIGWPVAAQFRIGGDFGSLTALATRLLSDDTHRPARVAEGIAAQIPLRVHLGLPGFNLPVSELRSLEKGDMLALGMVANDRILSARHLTCRISRTEAGWQIKEVRVSENDSEMSPDPQPAADPPEAEDAPQDLGRIEDIPVHLSFVVQDMTLSLAELQQLAPGAVLPFPVQDAAAGLPVRVLANGRTIGEGNLVEIDGHHAVRLSRFFDKD